MATPMFRDLSRALEAPEEGRELWSGVPAEEEPVYAEEMFRKASDAALARENALPKEGYVPAGVGPVVEPSMDSPLAPMPSGLRSRKPVDFAPDTTKLQGKLAGFLGGNQPLQGPGYARPLSDKEFASEQERARKLMAEDDATSRGIPTRSASVRVDAPDAVASTQPAVTSTSPAGPADSAGTRNFPPPSSEGAGGDAALGRLSLGQALTRALEGSGSIIAGRDLRSGAADTLGERMKQIEALRAKREERSMELAREDEQSSALVQQYKSLAAQGLVPELPALDRLPPKQAASLIKTYGSLPGLVQKTEKTKAEIPLVQAKTATEQGKPEIAKGGLEVKRGTLAERERSNKANEDIRRQALLLKKASDTKANNDVRAAGSDPKQAEKAITDAMKSAEKKDLGIASNIRDFQGLEAVAPGFTKGVVPSWLGQGSIAAAIKVPGLNKQATQLASALELFTAGIRNSLFGASLTGNEKESFDAIVSSGVLMPPDVLAANINRLREGAAKFAQNHFTVAQELHPEVTGRVLRASPLFGPATREGGVYSDVWMLPGGMVKVRHKASGKTTTVDRVKADEMLKRPDFEEVK